MALTKEVARTDEGIRFLEDLEKGKKIFRVYGIYGEIPGSDAYIDEVIKPETGGTFLKLYGCSYLFKGNPLDVQVHGLELAKSLIFQFPREILAKSWLYSLSFALQLIFYKRNLLERMDWIFNEIDIKVIKYLDLPEKEYNQVGKELKRVLLLSLLEEFGIDLTRPYYNTEHPKFRPEKRLPDVEDNKWDRNFLGYLIARIFKFICLFLELDNAYRFRFQDVFGMVDNAGAKKDGPKELYRLLDILISRETETGVPHKWKMIKLMAKIAFFFIPRLKRFMSIFLANLDGSKIEMDDADFFFCLTYHSYNFGGFSKKERYTTRKEINREKGHCWLIGYEEYPI